MKAIAEIFSVSEQRFEMLKKTGFKKNRTLQIRTSILRYESYVLLLFTSTHMVRLRTMEDLKREGVILLLFTKWPVF